MTLMKLYQQTFGTINNEFNWCITLVHNTPDNSIYIVHTYFIFSVHAN